jgi:hypothetical protein
MLTVNILVSNAIKILCSSWLLLFNLRPTSLKI